jgi:cbb3-type cytochrome oxidase maturation protein
MLPASMAVLWISAVLGVATLAGFAWAWSVGHFANLEEQAWAILDADDLRYERPWETPSQSQARAQAYGPLTPPPPGEWGGAG